MNLYNEKALCNATRNDCGTGRNWEKGTGISKFGSATNKFPMSGQSSELV